MDPDLEDIQEMVRRQKTIKEQNEKVMNKEHVKSINENYKNI